MVDLAFTEYAGMPNPPAPILTLFHEILAEHALPADVMILRDYHAENILWLPERHGAAQAGLLDFQDALQGHRAYDLVSLLEDARRDVTPATREAMLHHYIHATGQSDAAFRASFAVLGAQRNLRILGVFARLARVRHKPHYIDLIPRVWAHLQTDLAHPALAKLRPLVTNALPAPNAAHLHWLKSTCPTP
jgi:aminoglycoside/choline kinase family phosphotransferase